MTPFEPQGPRARWRIVYDLLTAHEVGDTVTYDAIADALDMDPTKNRHAIQMATGRAGKEFLLVAGHAIAAVPNVGYRIVEPEEHMKLAQVQQRRSNQALVRGRETVTYVDLSGMEPDVRKSFEIVARAFAMQMEFNKRIDVRQQELETALDTVVNRAERTDEEVRELKARLEALESKDEPKA